MLGLLFCLSGCVTPVEQPATLTTVPVSQTVSLTTNKAWPMVQTGTYLQQVTGTAGDEKHTFSILLTLDAETFDAIAYNDIAGRLYHLKWKPNGLAWEANPHIPKVIRPENILADYLLVHLPLKELNESLQGAEAKEQTIGGFRTRTISDGEVVRIIKYADPKDKIWGRVTIENPQYNYVLDIRTVKQ